MLLPCPCCGEYIEEFDLFEQDLSLDLKYKYLNPVICGWFYGKSINNKEANLNGRAEGYLSDKDYLLNRSMQHAQIIKYEQYP